MHEMHLVKDLFSDLLKSAKDNQAKKITKVYLKLGDFSEINEEIVRFYFKEKSQGTLAQGAEIDIAKSPNRELRLLSFDCE
ncbi:MAG: hydrogenase maturation nickel metallochaperone HypA [Candidatus Omnitrophica bacterium]|nr:hydrogenase maturation nickel metallochaperone HypA [Candidatus Omnitrophota bacterium]